jgi:hypothetical protein
VLHDKIDVGWFGVLVLQCPSIEGKVRFGLTEFRDLDWSLNSDAVATIDVFYKYFAEFIGDGLVSGTAWS